MTRPTTVAIITGTRAEFGLLRPVIDAVRKHKRLKLQLIAAGAHFLPPARTIREVRAAYPVAAEVRMQQPGKAGRAADAAALGRGVSGFASAFAKLKPDWVVVLGDRIEAFAAASAASIAGIAVCHIHGGDRAEGIADEAMRHAITKLSHLHCAATKLSAERIVKMGEKPEHVHVTGSPAIDGLDKIKPMSDREAQRYGDPYAVMLLHPSGVEARDEAAITKAILDQLLYCGWRTSIVLAPNADAGRDVIAGFIQEHRKVHEGRRVLARSSRTGRDTPHYVYRDHLPRTEFVAILKRLARPIMLGGTETRGVLIGNSSAGLIEAAAIGLPVVNVGARQSGRERGDNVIDVAYKRHSLWAVGPLESALLAATYTLKPQRRHPYGDGRAGPRIAALLAKTDPHDPALLRKRNSY